MKTKVTKEDENKEELRWLTGRLLCFTYKRHRDKHFITKSQPNACDLFGLEKKEERNYVN